MDKAEFEAGLRRDGFTEIATRSLAPGKTTPEHAHPFGVRALVLGGEITLTVEGNSTVYRSGDIFTMQGGCRHAEAVGPQGVQYLAGRRHPAAEA
jgi:quercetin dioxygenase-like cupin family protein